MSLRRLNCTDARYSGTDCVPAVATRKQLGQGIGRFDQRTVENVAEFVSSIDAAYTEAISKLQIAVSYRREEKKDWSREAASGASAPGITSTL
jgi:hypothetical protein